MLDKYILKVIFFSIAGITCISFFFLFSCTCLADENYDNIIISDTILDNYGYGNVADLGITFDGTNWHTDYDPLNMNGSITGAYYTPLRVPIENWKHLNSLNLDVCTDGTTNDGSDSNYKITWVYSDSAEHCLGADDPKCYSFGNDPGQVSNCSSESHWSLIDYGGSPLKQSDLACDVNIGFSSVPTDNLVLCGFTLTPDYTGSNPDNNYVGHTYITTIASDAPAGYLWNPDNPTGTSTYGAYYTLRGQLNAVPTPIISPCDCTVSTSTNWIDIGISAVYCGIKYSMCWAFYPDSGTIDNFATSTAIFKNKFPFNTYFDLTNSISDALSTSTNTYGGLGMPFVRTSASGTAEYYWLDSLSSSSLPKAIGGQNANLFRNGLSWILWIITAGIIITIILNTIL